MATIPVMVCIYTRSSAFVTGTHDLGEWWPVLMVRSLVESSSLLFSTIWLFAYAYRLNHRLSNLSEVVNVSTLRLSDIAHSKRPIQRVVRILLICAVCYTGRIFCLIILISEYTNGALNTDRFSNVGWFFLSTWIPTLIPGCVFLFTTRINIRPKKKKTLHDIFKNDVFSESEDYRTNSVDNPVRDSYGSNLSKHTAPFSIEGDRTASSESIEGKAAGHRFEDD